MDLMILGRLFGANSNINAMKKNDSSRNHYDPWWLYLIAGACALCILGFLMRFLWKHGFFSRDPILDLPETSPNANQSQSTN
ncbi:unnamed protein product [Caenorhabditis angaria]|uniref:Uncharacterized protein n=1 Tax=Caenorhabditis angaria TaxID=860376 RepID=A0A9P1IHJ1_9PELO|nr:unnamed protein product [Caenorhabditis angaria]